MSRYLERRKQLENDPIALEAFLEERRQNTRVWKQQQRERMDVDPEYAEQIRTSRRTAREKMLSRNPGYYREQRIRQLARDPDLDRKKNARKTKRPKTELEREQQAAYMREYRKRNPEKTISQQMKHPQHEKREALRLRKAAAGCEQCGERDGYCLDFHHRDKATKSFGIASSVNLYSLDELMSEADKCVVLCANCHRREHRKT